MGPKTMRIQDTVMKCLPEFTGHTALDGQVEVGALKDDKGGVAAQLQAQSLDGRRALPVQDLAHLKNLVGIIFFL